MVKREWVRRGGNRPGHWHILTATSTRITEVACGARLQTLASGRQLMVTAGRPMTGIVCSPCRKLAQ